MTYLIGVPLLAVAAVLQAAVLSRATIFGVTPDLVLLLSLSWTLVGEWQGGIVWGLIGGIFLDVLSGGPMGASALALVLAAWLAGLSEGRFWRSHVLLPLGTVLVGTLVFHGVVLVVLTSTGYPVAWAYSLARVSLPSLLLNIVCMLPVYHSLRWLHAFVHPAPVTI
jgi:rod shape-determining protein MreD